MSNVFQEKLDFFATFDKTFKMWYYEMVIYKNILEEIIVQNLFNIAFDWAVTAGSIVFVALLAVIAIASIAFIGSLVFSKTKTLKGFGRKSLVIYLLALIAYLAIGGIYNWQQGNVTEFFLAWMGFGIATTLIMAGLNSLLRKL